VKKETEERFKKKLLTDIERLCKVSDKLIPDTDK